MEEQKEFTQQDNNNGDIGRESGIVPQAQHHTTVPNDEGHAENQEFHGTGQDAETETSRVIIEETRLTHHGSHSENVGGTTEEDLRGF